MHTASVLKKGTKSINDSIKKITFLLFKHSAAKAKQADRSECLKFASIFHASSL
jgi:hypothetical protein